MLYCRTGLPRTEISQLPQCLSSFFAATTMTRVVTWQMFATVTQSNKVRTSRYWYMLSIIYWSKYSVSFVWRSCAEKNSASVYTWCVNIHSLLNCTWVKIFTHFTAMLWLKFPSRLRLCVGTICTLTSSEHSLFFFLQPHREVVQPVLHLQPFRSWMTRCLTASILHSLSQSKVRDSSVTSIQS